MLVGDGPFECQHSTRTAQVGQGAGRGQAHGHVLDGLQTLNQRRLARGIADLSQGLHYFHSGQYIRQVCDQGRQRARVAQLAQGCNDRLAQRLIGRACIQRLAQHHHARAVAGLGQGQRCVESQSLAGFAARTPDDGEQPRSAARLAQPQRCHGCPVANLIVVSRFDGRHNYRPRLLPAWQRLDQQAGGLAPQFHGRR